MAQPVPDQARNETDDLIISDDDIDAAIAEAGGDPREAVRALLHDIAILALDHARSVSSGYRRQRMFGSIDFLKLP
ncbi:hypothetical protein [Phreatobacter sp.]|uniref:hypothetical protein n=1 Tax=Phreatobacter sp. TaxID=1966341 RepID=UPI0025D04557|nr:hypothetical protein [Phreatobacter sp.]